MKYSLLILLSTCVVHVSGQLNCQTKRAADGSRTTSCFHANGTLSTIETWDANEHWGRLIAYTSEGAELINFNLRRVGGHASIDLEYHSNGQVSKAHFSDAPDGGIQFHKSTCWYDDQGRQTNCRDEGYPMRSPGTMLTIQPEEQPKAPLEINPPPAFIQEAMTCGAPCLSVYRIVNTTRKKVDVSLKAEPNLMVQRTDRSFKLLPGQELSVDSILMADLYFEPHTVYRPAVSMSGRKSRPLKVIADTPDQMGTRKVFTWYIVHK